MFLVISCLYNRLALIILKYVCLNDASNVLKISMHFTITWLPFFCYNFLICSVILETIIFFGFCRKSVVDSKIVNKCITFCGQNRTKGTFRHFRDTPVKKSIKTDHFLPVTSYRKPFINCEILMEISL